MHTIQMVNCARRTHCNARRMPAISCDDRSSTYAVPLHGNSIHSLQSHFTIQRRERRKMQKIFNNKFVLPANDCRRGSGSGGFCRSFYSNNLLSGSAMDDVSARYPPLTNKIHQYRNYILCRFIAIFHCVASGMAGHERTLFR